MLLKKIKRIITGLVDVLIICLILMIVMATIFLEYSDLMSIFENLFIYSAQFFFIFVSISILFYLFKNIRNFFLLRSVTTNDRGTYTERKLVMRLLKCGVPSELIFHDLYLQKTKGDYSQIDLVLITKVGLIVFEVKDYSGWIYGNGSDSKWTQVLAGGKVRHSFYNPFLQNATHVAELKKALKSHGDIPFFSVVVFYGDCEFKDIEFIPDGSYLVKEKRIWEVIQLIHKKNKVVRLDNMKIANILKRASKNGSKKDVQIKHIDNVKSKLGRDRIFD